MADQIEFRYEVVKVLITGVDVRFLRKIIHKYEQFKTINRLFFIYRCDGDDILKMMYVNVNENPVKPRQDFTAQRLKTFGKRQI